MTLRIQTRHIEAFERLRGARFEEEMIAHCHEFSPNLCRTLREPELRLFVREGVERACSYGLSQRGTIRLYLDMALLLGSGFDDDPMYPWARHALTAEELLEETYRGEMLYMEAAAYLREVHGEKNEHARAALERLLAFLDAPAPATPPEIVSFLRELHPEKHARLGDEGLRAFVEGSLRELEERRGQLGHPLAHPLALTMVTLRFCFGHRCLSDPLFPWIAKTFELYRGRDAEGIAEKLQSRSRIWIEAVLRNEASA